MHKNNLLLTKSLNIGITYGVIAVFLNLIAFTVVMAKIIGDTSSPSPAMYGFVLALFAFFCGIWASGKKNLAADSWKQVLTAGAAAGFVGGIVLSFFLLVFGAIHLQGIDLRTYLVLLSPEVMDLYLFEAGLFPGILITVALTLAGSLLGAAFNKEVVRAEWRNKAMSAGAEKYRQFVHSPRFQQLFSGRYSKTIVIIGALVLLFAMPFVWGSYWNYVMGTVGLYILLGLGMNIIVGLSGQLVLGYVAFFAIGAYAMGLLTSPEPLAISLGFWPALLISILLAALTGILLGLPILNLRGDYLAIVTLGFGEIIRILIKSDSLTWLTGGPKGLRNIAKPEIFGMNFSSDVNYMHLILIGVLLGLFIAYRLQNSRTGRAWLSIQGDQTVSRATGVNTYSYKILALALGAAFAGIGGAIFASRNQFTGPEDHIMMVSINVLCLVIVGGMGSIPGVILGSFVLKGIPELLRDLTDYRLMVFGALLVVMMIVRPKGLWPSGRPALEADYISQRKKPDQDDQSVKEVSL